MHTKYRKEKGEKNHPLFNHSKQPTANNVMYVLPVFSMHILFHSWDHTLFHIWLHLLILIIKRAFKNAF